MEVTLEATKWNNSYDKEWKLRRTFVKINFDAEELEDNDVKLEEKPEWTLS